MYYQIRFNTTVAIVRFRFQRNIDNSVLVVIILPLQWISAYFGHTGCHDRLENLEVRCEGVNYYEVRIISVARPCNVHAATLVVVSNHPIYIDLLSMFTLNILQSFLVLLSVVYTSLSWI